MCVIAHCAHLFPFNAIVSEIGLQNLIFVLKMDEVEIVKGEKMEHVNITLMNRALHEPNLPKNDDKYFLVQAEEDI